VNSVIGVVWREIDMANEAGFTLLIHHLSDIHLGKLHLEASNDLDIQGIETIRNIDFYLNYLNELKCDNLPDLLIITGDLTSFASKEEMETAKICIMNIKNILKDKHPTWRDKNHPYILIVPGNHDLDWSRSSDKGKIELYARMADSLHDKGVLSALYSDNKPVFCDFGDECNLFVYLLNSTFLGGKIDDGLKKIHETFYKEYSTFKSKGVSEMDYRGAMESLEKRMRLDPGYVSPDDIKKMKKELKRVPKNRLKVAVMHHNLSSIPIPDIERFDAIINAGQVKEALMDDGFDIVFHGHRHVTHCSYERYLAQPQSQTQGLFILGGDSLGRKYTAPFLEVRLCGTDKAHSNELPISRFTVSKAEIDKTKYNKKFEPLIEETIASPIDIAVGKVFKSLGSNISLLDSEDRDHLKEKMDIIQPPFQELQSSLSDWGEGSESWIKVFNDHLDEYHGIYATDYYPRSSLESPRFNKYLRKQYETRLKLLKSKSNHCLEFSQPVCEAIKRTNWHPDPTMWKDEITEINDRDSIEDLEIVRILIRPWATKQDRQKLENLDFDHKLFAIPLFVLESEQSEPDQKVDCAIGLNNKGKVIRSYEFKEKYGKVVEVDCKRRGSDLKDIFEEMLKDDALRTVNDFLMHGIMISESNDPLAFAGNYAKKRKPNEAIIKEIRKKFPNQREIGLDIGCGTGNYTIPFIEDFKQVIGLDTSKEMLDEARKRSDKVKWIEADASDKKLMHKYLKDNYCDAVWLISTLHYFNGSEQRELFKEIYRILKKGGTVFADIGFEEQLESLWVVDFFPSLKDRYRNRCFKMRQYRTWLHEIGYTNIRFGIFKFGENEIDAGIWIGQHCPIRYADHKLTDVIPAFTMMNRSEYNEGIKKLKESIRDKTIDGIIKKHEQKAKIKGENGFIIATRPRLHP